MNCRTGNTHSKHRSVPAPYLLAACLVLAPLAVPATASTFQEDLKRVDAALQNNPTGALRQSLESCATQRNYAVTLYRKGLTEQARQSLDYCFDSLRIPRTGPIFSDSGAAEEAARSAAHKTYEQAAALASSVDDGATIYTDCAACHGADGSGSKGGSVPHIAGQHRNVVIKQLADFRAGHRESGLMAPYACAEVIPDEQAMADVAGYVASLEVVADNGQGPGDDLELGQRLYRDDCSGCHGVSGEGSDGKLVPRLRAQHYRYLLRQFERIHEGERHNADAGMVATIEQYQERETRAVLDYASRLTPAR